ncbi:MAG: PIN domain-containing protein [Stackebrandtia sp.]
MVDPIPVIADTSVFVGYEGKRFAEGGLDNFLIAISTVTLGELRLGVLSAADPRAMSHRLSTFQFAQAFSAIPVDEAVSDAWSELIADIRRSGRKKMPINDSWIAATAKAHDVAVLTRVADFDDLPGVSVVKI